MVFANKYALSLVEGERVNMHMFICKRRIILP